MSKGSPQKKAIEVSHTNLQIRQALRFQANTPKNKSNLKLPDKQLKMTESSTFFRLIDHASRYVGIYKYIEKIFANNSTTRKLGVYIFENSFYC